MLDLWQNNQAVSARTQPDEGQDLPAGFGDTFDAAWHEGQLFGSSIASFNARQAALNNYITEIQQKTGKRLDYDAEGGADGWAQINDQAEKLGIKPLPDDEIDRRSAAVAGEAHQAYSEMAAREKTLGGKVGGVLGGLAAGATDPINLVALPVAPEAELGILGTAALWGGYGAVTQAANEVANAPFRQQAVPGYDEAAGNILSAGVGGAVLGGLFKGLGNVWTRMKTGEWPRSVRDAGNIVESEANTQSSNIMPGVEGEVDHRTALQKGIDDIVAGNGTDARPSGFLAAYEQKMQPVMDAFSDVKAARNAVQMERAAQERQVAPELPFAGSIAEGQEVAAVSKLGEHLENLAQSVGSEIPPDVARALADKISRLPADQATAALDEFMLRPRTLPDTLPSVSAITKASKAAGPELPTLTPEAMEQTLADPKHAVAMATDLERLRDQGTAPQMIPVGVDEKGEPTYQLLDAAIQDAKNDEEAAAQLESCVNPPPEQEEAMQPLRRDVEERGRSGRPISTKQLGNPVIAEDVDIGDIKGSGNDVHIMHDAEGSIRGIYGSKEEAEAARDIRMRENWEKHGKTFGDEFDGAPPKEWKRVINEWNGEHPDEDPINPSEAGYTSDARGRHYTGGLYGQPELQRRLESLDNEWMNKRLPYPGPKKAARFFEDNAVDEGDSALSLRVRKGQQEPFISLLLRKKGRQ